MTKDFNTTMEMSEKLDVFEKILKLVNGGYDVTLRSLGDGRFKIAKAKPEIVSMD